MFYGRDLNLRTLPFFPLVKELGALNSLTYVPVICLPLQSSACNNVASHCQGRFMSQRWPRWAISSDGKFASLRTAHTAKMRCGMGSADEDRLSNIPVLWFHVMCGLGRGKSYEHFGAWGWDSRGPSHADLWCGVSGHLFHRHPRDLLSAEEDVNPVMRGWTGFGER